MSLFTVLFPLPLVYVMLLTSVTHYRVLADSADAENCDDAQKRCMQQMGCSMAIHNYMIHCSTLINGETNRCNYHCRMALISLLSTEDQTGETFMTCNCGEHSFCRESKSRLSACRLAEITEAVKEVYDPEIKLTCSLAEMICAADTSCFTALTYYEQHCRKLVKGSKCTARCNNSLSILYRQPKALKLRNCICDGMEKYDCPALRYNIETLCFNKPRVRHNPDHSTRSRSNGHHHNHQPTSRPDSDSEQTLSGEENQVDNGPHKGGGKSALTAQHNGAEGPNSPGVCVTKIILVLLLAAVFVI